MLCDNWRSFRFNCRRMGFVFVFYYLCNINNNDNIGKDRMWVLECGFLEFYLVF